jgi:hypothetical protein
MEIRRLAKTSHLLKNIYYVDAVGPLPVSDQCDRLENRSKFRETTQLVKEKY